LIDLQGIVGPDLDVFVPELPWYEMPDEFVELGTNGWVVAVPAKMNSPW
jgi:hypothetical protein